MALAETSPQTGSAIEQAYLELLREIVETGEDQTDRTGTGTRGVFGRQIRCDLKDGFPLLTTKKVFFKGVAVELMVHQGHDQCGLAAGARGAHLG